MSYKFSQPRWRNTKTKGVFHYACRDAVYGVIKEKHNSIFWWEARCIKRFGKFEGYTKSFEDAKLLVEVLITGTSSSLFLQQKRKGVGIMNKVEQIHKASEILSVPVENRTEEEHHFMIKYFGSVREYLLTMGEFKEESL